MGPQSVHEEVEEPIRLGAAQELGVRDSFHEDPATWGEDERYGAFFAEFAELAAKGAFTIPIAATLPLEDWRTALDVSLTGHARGKLLLLPGAS